MGKEFFEQGELPEKQFRGYVRRVEPGLPVQVCIASYQFWKCWVHYHGKSIGCMQSREKCPGCRLGWIRKFLGYLYVRNERNHRYEHLELPFEACHNLVDLIGPEGQLRGTRLHASRHGGKKGRISFDLLTRLSDVAPEFNLADDRDPSDILEYLWGVNYSKLRLAGNDGLPSRDAI